MLRNDGKISLFSTLTVFTNLLVARCDFGVQGPVVQSIVSLTASLRGHLVKYIPLHYKIHCYFLLENVRIFCIARDSHIFSTKITSYL